MSVGFWALVAFHAILLWARLSTGELWSVPVAARYAASALVLAGLWWMRRGGHSPFRGRRAVVLWVGILILHASFIGVADVERWTQDPAWWAALPAAAVPFLAACLALVAAIALPPLSERAGWIVSFALRARPGVVRRRAPRGPPLALSFISG